MATNLPISFPVPTSQSMPAQVASQVTTIAQEKRPRECHWTDAKMPLTMLASVVSYKISKNGEMLGNHMRDRIPGPNLRNLQHQMSTIISSEIRKQVMTTQCHSLGGT